MRVNRWRLLEVAVPALGVPGRVAADVAGPVTGLPGFGLDGAQYTGHCQEVAPEALARHHRLYYERNFPDARVRRQWLLPEDDFRGDGPRRFYTVTVHQWWLLDIERWLVDKYDQRIHVPLEAIADHGIEEHRAP
ncbi:hypothetical protein ACFYNO_39440 [Kitasatospora sp. NPDC006697]|uniref:hypothetical protein n=1 Tax=Kitasatospora sp. NPDC006697 TaxID=3364020 RepID=UPI0036AFF32C